MRKSGVLGWMPWAVGAALVSLLASGCAPECETAYDCAQKNGPLSGQRYVCEAEQCVVRDITPPEPVPDAGTPDAGTPDSGTPDSGTPDSGTPDSGTPDAGPPEVVLPAPDPAPDTGVDCAQAPHDTKLGTLRLEAGFSATESAPLPAGIGAVVALTDSATPAVYGLNGADASLYALGTWPALASSTTLLVSVISPEDKGKTTYLGGYVASDGQRLMAGYTRSDVSGAVALHDTLRAGSASFFSARGNYSVVGTKDVFLINGLGLEGSGFDDAIGVYGFTTGEVTFRGWKLATFPANAEYSGYNARTSTDIAVFGYAQGTPTPGNPYATSNFLHAVAPSTWRAAVDSLGTLDLSRTNTPLVYKALDVLDVSGFGEGVAIRRGFYDGADYSSLTRSLVYLPLSASGESASWGASRKVLTAPDTCTRVLLQAPLAGDLLVGVSDKNGRRLVRLHATP
ncbi:hypothetical protein [Melittangium boletus]|uniref:hypothetical protein n=1 Tax=Melittangium boletus TaxID=83453 RepID=UPI003DA50994